MLGVLILVVVLGLCVGGLGALIFATWRFERRRRLARERLAQRPLDITPVPRPRRR